MAQPASATTRESNETLRVALIGNPNTGKTTLFNALTGLRQRVANFAGVTVERVEGSATLADGRRATILDLPGSYSLSAGSPDEQIALEVLLGRDDAHYRPHVVCVVADASHLERNLYLASQVIELGLPVVIALNQFDVAESQGIKIDVPALIHELGVPVIPTVAHRGEGLDPLRRALVTAANLPAPMRRFTLPPDVDSVLAPLQGMLERGGINYAAAGMEALRLLGVSRDEPHLVHVDGLTQKLEAARKAIADAGYVPERLESEIRYTWIGAVLSRCVQRVERTGGSFSDRIDSVLLHRTAGPLIFLAVMALVFQSVFTWAAPVQDLFEGAAVGLGSWVGSFLPEGDLQSLVVDGVFAGVGSVIVFVPQIAILFLFIGLLEQTGYMARAAYLMDRVMRRVGLHGKSFIPMLSGYACAVPGIMATRTIDDPKDRLATIMVVPLMSCSARLPVYTLLIGTFVPALPLIPGLNLQGFTMLVMYLLGTIAALVIAFLFRRTLLRGPVRPMLLELPGYRWPSMKSLLLGVWQRCAVFLRRAGTVILSISIVLWALATYPKAEVDDALPELVQQEQQLAHSVLGRFGHAVEPVVAPLGYDWKIGVSIVASFAAREVFVSTMGTIYGVGGEDEGALSERLKAERKPDGSPRYTPLVAVGLMVFYVFALMCISTVAITVREAGGGALGWRWAAIQFGYMFVLAYVAAYAVIVVGRAMGFAG